MARKEFLWTEKYRPKTIEECILPPSLKNQFQKFVEQKKVPNILLVGPAGTGKTTVARAMLEELGADYILINASLANKETLKSEIVDYASSVSFMGGRKYVILDEADGLDKEHFQKPLRQIMEKFSGNCGFILTANFKDKLIEPLQSRNSIIDFKIPKAQFASLATKFLKRVCNILDEEKVVYDKQVVATVIETHFPDWRRVLNEFQRYSAAGNIDSGILSTLGSFKIEELMSLLKGQKFTEVRKWVAQNLDQDSSSIFKSFYDNAADYFTPVFCGQLVLLLSRYQYYASQVADHEINMMAFMTEVMIAAEWR